MKKDTENRTDTFGYCKKHEWKDLPGRQVSVSRSHSSPNWQGGQSRTTTGCVGGGDGAAVTGTLGGGVWAGGGRVNGLDGGVTGYVMGVIGVSATTGCVGGGRVNGTAGVTVGYFIGVTGVSSTTGSVGGRAHMASRLRTSHLALASQASRASQGLVHLLLTQAWSGEQSSSTRQPITKSKMKGTKR